MNFETLCESRHSVRKYEPGLSLADEDLEQIFSLVTLSPSSFNIQHWQFIVVRENERKKTLSGLSYGQQQVADCAAAVFVCGRLDAYRDAARIYADSPAEMREKYVPMIEGSYHGRADLQREEVIRSGAIAAMSLMYAAKSLGWDSGPMIGFEADKVSAYLELGDNTIPVMLVVIGKALHGEQPARAYRRPLDEVVMLETAAGARLAPRGS